MSFYSFTEILIIMFVLLSTEYSNGQLAFNKSFMTLNGASNAGIPRLWISDLFYQALANFTVRHVENIDCLKQVEIYDNSLRNYTSWAVRMSESWNRYPVGILTGNKYQMGVYDECVDVHHPIRGQYCLSEIKLLPLTGEDYSFNRSENLDDFGNNHAWKTILGWVDYPDQVQRNSLNLGICIPSSCSASDLQKSLQNELDNVFLPEQFKAVVNVNPVLCTVSEDMYPYNTAYYVTNIIFGVMFLICGVATAHNYVALSCQQKKNQGERKILLNYNKENEFNIINGLKAIMMFPILLGHRFMYLVGNPIINPKFIEHLYLHGHDIYLTSMNLTDPFFFMTGFLIYTTLVPMFKKLKKKSILVKLIIPIVYRIIRILPAYCAMMAITAHIVPHLGDGPLWSYKTWDEAEICKNYWWTNMLFISNLIDSKYECLVVSWYISCDIQFCILGVIIVYIYTKNIKFGIGLIIAMLGVSMSVPFIITILTKREGIVKILLPFLENIRYSATFNESYRASYMRAFPFFTGIAIGVIIDKLKKNKVKFSQMTVYAGTFTIAVICLWIQFYGAIFYKRDRPYYLLEQALYSTLNHCTWVIFFAWVFICHFTSGYGLLTKFLNNRFIVPIGRLSYSVFLVNLTVMMISQSRLRAPNYLSKRTVIDAWMYDTLKSYLMGIILFMVIEAPVGNLAGKFLKGK